MGIKGSQFGSYLQLGLWLVIGMMINTDLNIVSLKRFTTNRINIGFIVLLIVILSFSVKLYKTDMAYLKMRLPLQGHVFWGTINHVRSEGTNPDFSYYFKSYNDLFEKFTMGNVNQGFGKLMYEISPDFSVRHLNSGLRFSAGYPAITIYHFGYTMALMINVIALGLYYITIRYFILSLLTKDILQIYIMYLIMASVADFLIMGEYMQFRLKFLIKITILIVLTVAVKNKNKFVIKK